MIKPVWTEDNYEYRMKMEVYPQRIKKVGLDHVYDTLPKDFTKDTDFVITKEGKRVPILKLWEDDKLLSYFEGINSYERAAPLEKGTIVLDDFQKAPKRITIAIPVSDDIKANKRKAKYYIYYKK